MTDNFTTIPFTKENLDLYLIRTSIFKALNAHASLLKGKLLDIGCGKMPYKQFILDNSAVKNYTGLDIENALPYDESVKADYTWDGVTMPFKNSEFDSAFGTEVLEHCPDPKTILNEVNRVLKPGGVFFFTVPFIWPLHEVPHDEFRYTPFSLTRLLKETGFEKIEIRATGGWYASLAQMLGLWVRQCPLKKRNRKILSLILKPVIGYLIRKDRNFTVQFTESQMITGLSGIAYKTVHA